MIMKKIVLAVCAMPVVLSVNLQAREFADIYTECGLGAMIAPNNEVVAAVTNVTWDLGTTAISSNISSAESCQGGGASMAALLYQAYPSIEREIAIGEGEHLSALVSGLPCGSAETTVSLLRTELGKLVDDADYSEDSKYDNAEALFNAINTQICSLG